MVKPVLAVGFAALLVASACVQDAPSAVQSTGPRLSATPPSSPSSPAATLETPPPTPATAATSAATPAPPAASEAPARAVSVSFGPGSITVSVSGLAGGAHLVHVHRDCTGNPARHVTALGVLLVDRSGSGSRVFALATSLTGRGLFVLVYPLGASQGPPDVCASI